jgi:predicted O-methyltransferase YrrM
MTPETWTGVDDYLSGLFVPSDPALDGALEHSTAAGLPAIAVSPPQGKFLHLLARIRGARRILEIGTLGGYSTIWLARALPAGGRLISLEFEPKHAAVARENVQRAGLGDRVEIRVGRGLDLLPALPADERFDLVFIDADKPSTPEYIRWALKLTRAGSIIVVDNVVRGGDVLDAKTADANARGMRDALAYLAAAPGVTSTVIQTVGSKGYDGFAIGLVG